MADRDQPAAGVVDEGGFLPDTISDPGEEGGVDAPNEGDDEPDDER